jgi:hypothetical protein
MFTTWMGGEKMRCGFGLTRSIMLLVILVLLTGLAFGCSPGSVPAGTPGGGDETGGDTDGGEGPAAPPEIDLAIVKPNEIGMIPILMYHEIGKEEKDWERTAANFRRDLQRLYDEGYRLLSLNDLLQNNITTPAGCTPVVLTFDDGTAGQMRYFVQPDGPPVLDPDCAVGILLDLAAEQPDFGLAGTFYIYYPRPFRQKETMEMKLRELVRLGFEIGNHTNGHENLAKVPPERIREELAKMAGTTAEIVPGYRVKTLALPYGGNPRSEWRELLAAGEYGGAEYQNDAVLLVGANPAPGPNHKQFDPLRLPRIQATQKELDHWLEYLAAHPEKRYISDGDPAIVTVPAAAADAVRLESLDEKTLRQY